MTATTILSEAGWDMSKWETEDHFVSWLRLCPDNRISGNRVIGKGRLPTNNRVTIALKMAASTLRLSGTYLGAQFRRFRTRLGAPVAIKAMAANWPAWSTACSATGCSTSTKERRPTRSSTGSYRSSSSSGKPPPWDTNSSEFQRLKKHEFLGSITILERRVNRHRNGRSRGARCSGIRKKCWRNWWES